MTTKIFDYSQQACADNAQDLLLVDFAKIIKRYFFLHLFFISLMVALIVLFFFFFSFIEQSYLMAVVAAFFFFSFAMYFVLRLYAKEQKPQSFIMLCQQYMMASCAKNAKAQAERALVLAKKFDAVAPLLYKLFFRFSFLKKIAKHLCIYCCWQDVHFVKELFLLAMIDELKTCVKEAPTDISAHKNLAEGYLILSSHYKEPLVRTESYFKGSEKTKEELAKKFQFAACAAIEEFLIIAEYCPDDPSVYKRLASGWHDAEDAQKEIQAYETVVTLDPTDTESLLSLGILYFQHGQNVKGLHVYEKLRKQDIKASDRLISYYGAYQPFDLYASL